MQKILGPVALSLYYSKMILVESFDLKCVPFLSILNSFTGFGKLQSRYYEVNQPKFLFSTDTSGTNDIWMYTPSIYWPSLRLMSVFLLTKFVHINLLVEHKFKLTSKKFCSNILSWRCCIGGCASICLHTKPNYNVTEKFDLPWGIFCMLDMRCHYLS